MRQTLFFYWILRPPPVNAGLAGGHPTFRLASPIRLASSKVGLKVTAVLRGAKLNRS